MEVELTPQAARALDELSEPIHSRVLRILQRLRRWPNVSGAKPLSGEYAGHWRMRTGDYRIQFHVAGQTVVVQRIGHRDGFYE
jgi:mRNA-degrading endonuclease RelE of RelBE toxin-antitoxin system